MYVGGDVTIPAGVTLTIAAGTEVQLSGSGDVMGSGLDETKAELVVYGTLIAEGVTFTSADDAKWGGLVLYGDPLTHTTSSVVQGCTIEKATTGVHLETVEWTLGGATIGTGNRIYNCALGLHIKGNSGSLRFDPRGNVIRNNTIEGCLRGLQIERASGTRIEQNLFTGNGPYKIQVWGQRSDNTQIVNNTLHSTGGDRGKGIQFKGGTSGVVRNTIASGFPQGGVVAQGAVSEKAEDVVRVDYYLGHGNGDADLSGTVASTRRALWSAPKFRDAAMGDYTLQADSPGLDLGTPALMDPNDGSRIDLGRYGGTERAGQARGRWALEEYFSNGRVSSGWTGAVGTWSGDATQGTYQVAAHAQGSPRSYQRIDAAQYTVETRVRGAAGQVLYMQAGQSDSFRVQLSAAQDLVQLSTRASNGQEVVQGTTVALEAETWYSVRVEVGTEQVWVWVNGELTHTAVSLGAPADGVVGVGSASGAQGAPTAAFDYFLVLNATPATLANFSTNPLNGRVELFWDDPEDETITAYEYRYISFGAGAAWSAWTEIGGSNPTSHTVSGLTNGTQYTFEVRAVNAVGAGLPSAQRSARPSGKLGSNTAPSFDQEGLEREVAENSGAGTEVGAPVTAQDSNQDDELSYSLTGSDLFAINESSGQITVSESATSTTLSYEAATQHTVTVGVSDGKNEAGQPSTAVDATISVMINIIDVDEPPGVPTDVTVEPAETNGHEELVVSWMPPVNTGPPLSKYRVEACPSDFDVCTMFGHEPLSSTEIEIENGMPTSSTTLAGLASNTEYRVRVWAKNDEGIGPWSTEQRGSTAVQPLTVAYSASSYEAQEGGTAVSVQVKLSPMTDRVVSIPITVTADSGTEEDDYTVEGLMQGMGMEEDDYTVGGSNGGTLSFARGESIRTFTITANVDEDEEDETVSLGLGMLPEGVSAGMPASATVTLLDVPDQPQNLRAMAGNGQVLLGWDDLEDDSVTEWQYRGEQYHPTQRVDRVSGLDEDGQQPGPDDELHGDEPDQRGALSVFRAG